MCDEEKKEVPNMNSQPPCKKAIIIREDKVEEFLRKDNKDVINRALERSKKYSYIITDKTKGN